MGQNNMFSLSSITNAYKQIATPPERRETEHPYEFIREAYGFHTIASRETQLPGFSPPSYVSLAYLLHRVVTLILLLSIAAIGVGLAALGIEAVTNIQFTFTLPFTGWVLYEFESDAMIVVTPLFLVGILYCCSSVGYIWSNSLAHRLSEPYEEEYEAWLDDLKPPENGFPAGLAEVYYTDDNTELREELKQDNIPTAAPPAFRPPTVYEKSLYVLCTVLYLILWVFLHPMRVQNDVMYRQMTTLTEEVAPSEEVKQRSKKYNG